MNKEIRNDIEGRIIRLPPREHMKNTLSEPRARFVWLGRTDHGWAFEIGNEAGRTKIVHLEQETFEALFKLWNIREVD